MTEWERDNRWRQGLVIPTDVITVLGLTPAKTTAPAIAVVVSHDCDITQAVEIEPHVEVIIGHIIANSDGNCTHAKNPRRLHLPCTGGSQEIIIELNATAKRAIAKIGHDGLEAHQPAPDMRFTAAERNILQRWLAARYRRAAFPEEFDRRLDRETGLWNASLKILKPTAHHISTVFVDVDAGAQIERQGTDDCYSLAIYLLYDTSNDPAAAEAAAVQAAQQIDAAFTRKCRADGHWRWFELVECTPIADTSLTYAQSQTLMKWNLDYLSLRGDPVGRIGE